MTIEARYWNYMVLADIEDTGVFDAFYRHAEQVLESVFLIYAGISTVIFLALMKH